MQRLCLFIHYNEMPIIAVSRGFAVEMALLDVCYIKRELTKCFRHCPQSLLETCWWKTGTLLVVSKWHLPWKVQLERNNGGFMCKLNSNITIP